jgi:hypothetical protein
MRILGFAGTAKNTGKTTTALQILDLSRQAGLQNALTSIGYDGENLDHVTGLPKPRYLLSPGDLMATADSCLQLGTAAYKIIETTPIRTILGQIVIARVTRAGYGVLAGPNRSTDLLRVYEIFSRLQSDLVIADGALNRLVPLISTDGLVLSTGAALDERIPVVADHAAMLVELMHSPLWKGPAQSTHAISLGWDHHDTIHLSVGSLLTAEIVLEAVHFSPRSPQRLSIPGACGPKLLIQLLANPKFNELNQIILADPLKAIASGTPQSWMEVKQELERRQGQLFVERLVPVHLLTVNPFFPRFYANSWQYEAGEVDKIELLSAVRQKVQSIPVVDIRQPPLPDLLALVGLQRKMK